MLVNLDALYPNITAAAPTTPAAAGDGLVMSGWTAGALHRWLRSSTGQWIGVCTVLIARSGGGTYRADDQLVPATALRQRPT